MNTRHHTALAPDIDADRKIVLTRLLEFPREKVFRAFTEAEHVARWWGPDGFTNTIMAMDVRPGGTWRFVMHGPDGTDYPNRIVFTEVDPPSRLVYEHGGDSEPFRADFNVVVTFDTVGNATRLTMQLIFQTVEDCERVKSFGAVEGGRQTLERLARHLSGM